MDSRIYLAENKVIVEEKKTADQLQSKGFGERKGNQLILDLFEAVYLMRKEKIAVTDLRDRELTENDLLKKGLSIDKKFYSKLIVFESLKQAGYVLKSGLKFGSDFRVYPKGKKAGEAHTQWTLNVYSEDMKMNFPELSRLIRLTQNIKANALIAVVDRENDVNLFEIKRVTV
ncbi:MAG: tRNA-intron lyase [Candidatus Diapherotrites archaeon]